MEDFFQQKEQIDVRQMALKKEETELGAERKELERERNLHVRELKRIANEDASPFNAIKLNPTETYRTLKGNDNRSGRYLLLHLLGTTSTTSFAYKLPFHSPISSTKEKSTLWMRQFFLIF